jgi:hypothetical protein
MADVHPPEPHHPDTAGYVLGTLDPGEAAAFEAHLAECARCRAEIDELRPLPALLDNAPPPVVLPEGLRARTLAAVAATPASQDAPAADPLPTGAVVTDLAAGRARREARRGPVGRLLLAAGAVAAGLVIVLGVVAVRGTDRGPITEVALPVTGGGLEIEKRGSGWRIDLDTELPRRDEGRYYEAFVEGPDGRVSVGTFNDGDDVVLWSGVPLTVFDEFVIVEQPDGAEVVDVHLDVEP